MTRHTPSIVVAAFEPFGRRRRNRSQEAVALLVGESVDGHAFEVATLPTAFAALPSAISELFARRPAALLLVGESRTARRLMVERLAVNVAHARIRDNHGERPIDDEVVEKGVLALGVRFDPRRLANAALVAGVPCDVSAHAGTFCCNAAFYHALDQAERLKVPIRVAFVHVPARRPWARNARAAKGLTAIAHALVIRR